MSNGSEDDGRPTCFSVCSGIGGLDEGLRRAGFRHVGLCESVPYRRDVLRVRFPGVPIWDDIRDVGVEPATRAPKPPVAPALGRPGGFTQSPFLLSSPAAPPARTSPSPGAAPDSTANAPASSSSSPGSLTLFDPSGFSGRTFPVRSLHTAVGTSESCLERWPTSGTAWPGGLSTAVTSECRSDADGCSSSEPALTEILEPPQDVPPRYSLSARAAEGILRRAVKRGRTLPPHLEEALATVAATTGTRSTGGGARPSRG